jgi:hypothetical protein
VKQHHKITHGKSLGHCHTEAPSLSMPTFQVTSGEFIYSLLTDSVMFRSKQHLNYIQVYS